MLTHPHLSDNFLESKPISCAIMDLGKHVSIYPSSSLFLNVYCLYNSIITSYFETGWLLVSNCLQAIQAIWINCLKEKGAEKSLLLIYSTEVGGYHTVIIVICLLSPAAALVANCSRYRTAAVLHWGWKSYPHRAKGQEELFNFLFFYTLLPADPCVGKLLAQNWKEVRVTMECNTYGVLLMTRKLNTTDDQWNIW